MNYTKPEVAIGGSALAEIQGTSSSKGSAAADLYASPIGQPNATVNAYEADE